MIVLSKTTFTRPQICVNKNTNTGDTKFEVINKEGAMKMTDITPIPNDGADDIERLKKTIDNKRAAQEAMKFAKRDELTAIKEKNERREQALKNFGKY